MEEPSINVTAVQLLHIPPVYVPTMPSHSVSGHLALSIQRTTFWIAGILFRCYVFGWAIGLCNAAITFVPPRIEIRRISTSISRLKCPIFPYPFLWKITTLIIKFQHSNRCWYEICMSYYNIRFIGNAKQCDRSNLEEWLFTVKTMIFCAFVYFNSRLAQSMMCYTSCNEIFSAHDPIFLTRSARKENLGLVLKKSTLQLL